MNESHWLFLSFLTRQGSSSSSRTNALPQAWSQDHHDCFRAVLRYGTHNQIAVFMGIDSFPWTRWTFTFRSNNQLCLRNGISLIRRHSYIEARVLHMLVYSSEICIIIREYHVARFWNKRHNRSMRVPQISLDKISHGFDDDSLSLFLMEIIGD